MGKRPGDLEADDYREIKSECNQEIKRLENQLAATKPERVSNHSKYIDRALERLSRLDLLYENGDIETKRELIGSIFPEKLCFSKTGYRTRRINVLVGFIYQINNGLCGKKMREKRKNRLTLIGWSCRDSNPGPDRETLYRLHV